LEVNATFINARRTRLDLDQQRSRPFFLYYTPYIPTSSAQRGAYNASTFRSNKYPLSIHQSSIDIEREHETLATINLYKAIIQSDIPVNSNKKIWKLKIPLKTKIFGWYLRRGVILTKDNLFKRN
jgi:hypothetical protein